MSKSGAYKVNSSVDMTYRDDNAEKYLQYIDACGQILMKYKEEIKFVENMYSELREERLCFFNNGIINLKKTLEEEHIPDELMFNWICEIKQSFDDSFIASEEVLKDYSLATINEMKNKIRELINE